MTSAADFDSISVGLPREWATLPLDDAGFDRLCADLRRRWREDPTWDRTTERRAELLLARVRAEMRRVNVRFAAMYVQSPPDGAPADEETLMAACTLATYTQADLGTTLPLTASNLLTAFVAKPRRRADERRITNLEPPSRHQLRLGPAIRLRRLYELERPTSEADRLYAETFVLPIGDDATTCGLLQFVTPNLKMARGFSSLFVAIAETMILLTPEQETELAALEPRR